MDTIVMFGLHQSVRSTNSRVKLVLPQMPGCICWALNFHNFRTETTNKAKHKNFVRLYVSETHEQKDNKIQHFQVAA